MQSRREKNRHGRSENGIQKPVRWPNLRRRYRIANNMHTPAIRHE